jgi:hypothetical protein
MSKPAKRIEAMLARAYELATQVLTDEPVNHALAEEVAGESAELLALLSQDWGSFESSEVIDPELLEMAQVLSNREVNLPKNF